MKTLILLLVLSFSILGQTYRYVDPEATGANNGLSWQNAWNGFDDFNINDHSKVPPGTTILVAAGTYTTGHSSYNDAVIKISNNNNVTIKPGDPGFEEGDPLVIFSGSSSMPYGIVAQPADCLKDVNNISILGIKFEGFTRNPVKLSGFLTDCNPGNFVENVNILFCHFSDITNPSPPCSISCAAIHVQIAKNINIERCRIIHNSDVMGQTDGIYMDYSEEVEIRDNYIYIKNNETPPAGCGDGYYHNDCIQFADRSYGKCTNIMIERNQLIQDGNDHRHQGIAMTGIEGAVEIYTNNIVGKVSQNLLNIYVYSYTSSLYIFNNTLIGKENNLKLAGIHNVSGDLGQILKIRNNIFYKEGGNNPVGLTFFLPKGISFSNNILDYNLYHNPSTTMKIEISINSNSTSYNWYEWDENGIGLDPDFQIIDDLYTLSVNSPAKNKALLQNYGPADDFFKNKRPYWPKGVDLGAFEIPEAQLKIGWVDGSAVEHTLTAVGTYWKKEQNAFSWPVSTDPSLALSTFEPKSMSSNKEEWDGFYFNWMRNTGTENPMGHAFYKVSAGSRFFYLDLRDAVTEYNPNIYIRYSQLDNLYSYWNGSNFIQINNNGTILRAWLVNNGLPNTASLDNFWANCLVQIEEENHPKFVWGPYPGTLITDYRLYRSGNYPVGNRPDPPYASLQNIYNELDYQDNSVTIGGNINMRSYYLKGLTGQIEGVTEPTNIVDLYLLRQHKLADNNYNIEYELKQNFPNPFNPTTTISFSIPQDTQVNLVIYDILGREVETLVNDNLAAGVYEARFNARSLSSGIYLYRLSAGKYSETKKFQLIK